MIKEISKKKFASTIIATSLCVSVFGGVTSAASSGFTSSAVVTQSETTKRSYALINDASNTLSAEQAKELEKKLNDIQDRARTDTMGVKIYSFVYSDQKSVSEVSDGLVASYGTESDIAPIIFVYNKSTQDYRFVVDNRVATYVSKGYLENLIDKSLVANKDFDANTLENTILRFNTVISTAFVTNATGQEDLKFDGVDVKPLHFKDVDFGEATTKRTGGQKSILEDEKKPEKKDNDNDMYVLGGIILALITGGVILFIKKKKNN